MPALGEISSWVRGLAIGTNPVKDLDNLNHYVCELERRLSDPHMADGGEARIRDDMRDLCA